MRVFVLDDDENRHKEFRRRNIGNELVTAYTAEEAIQKLFDQPPFDIVQLDHDLGGQTFVESDNLSGFAVARAIAEMAGAKRHGRVIVHSYNAEGAINMMRCLVAKGMPVEYRPFGVWE